MSVGSKNQTVLEELLQKPEVIQLRKTLESGGALSFSGLCESSKPFFICLGASLTQKNLCVIAATVKQQEYLYSELSAIASLFGVSSILNFPELESVDEKSIPDLESVSERLAAVRTLQQGGKHLLIATKKAWNQTIPSSESLKKSLQLLKRGGKMDLEKFSLQLVEWGYEQEAQVEGRGHYARRGGILDVFSFHQPYPVRIEFLGDEIDSIRIFNLDTQASVQEIAEIEILGMPAEKNGSMRLTDAVPDSFWTWTEPLDPHNPVELSLSDSFEAKVEMNFDTYGHDFLNQMHIDPILQEKRQDLLTDHWEDWSREGYRICVFCNNEGEEHRLKELVTDKNLIERSDWFQSPVLRGFIWPTGKWVMVSDAEVFGRYQTLSMARVQKKLARARARREALDFSEFSEGDFVVHVHHGIGKFSGIRKIAAAGGEQEVLSIEYSGGALLHVPIEQAYLVGRYVGLGKLNPELDELGGKRWAKAAAQAQQAVQDYAAKLLKLEAERKADKGFKFTADTEWQKEFEDSFLYDETADQSVAIEDTKSDMESDKPMDRLICGDVGFGKTEVAIRAAFKAVMNGKQVAVLAPTTVLAQQHERTFRERMADYPVRIDLLSRFRTKAEQRKTIKLTKEGGVDILIGTHRLLQPDVVFKDLGLVVVDEEQRFGVKHKERFKEQFKLVDILTLSATPIPRTLYLSLMGAKDISTIETPPVNRLPVETIVAPYDERLIRASIERELSRGGQVYFLHNRVQSIQRVRDRIAELVPNAKVEFGHGQMDEDELESIMMRFVQGDIDVLVATTIIESGLDIPRANTIIIDRADRFGLADLYQLRGRVGRSQMKAHAYLLLPRHLMLEATARKRVSAVKQYSYLGAGFKVAMRDLEIRGAGNILGIEQSGHATAIGFELYCQLLKETLARMKGEKVRPRIDVIIRLDFLPVSEDQATGGVGAFIPRSYMSASKQRIEAYRHLAEIIHEKELRKIFDRWQDRFGKAPRPVLWLMELAKIRLAAAEVGIASVVVEEDKLMLQRAGNYILVGSKFPRLSPTKDVLSKMDQVLKLVSKLGKK
jgi:transcription-repair coupling factor (superfamily II helicase)